MAVFRVIWLALKDIFDELFILVAVNLLWLLFCAPLPLLAAYLAITGFPMFAIVVALLAVAPLGPSNAGLYAIAQRVSEGRVISWRLFFEGFREYRTLGWQVYGLWMVGLLVILTNLSFYNRINSGVSNFLFVVFLYFLLIWVALLIYIGPLMLLQTDKRVRLIARNAAVMVFGRPIFTLITLALMAVIVALSVPLPVLPLFLTFVFLAMWSFRATAQLIADAEARRLAHEERQASTASGKPEKGRGGQVRPRD